MQGSSSAGSFEEPAEAERPVIRDKRRIDPETGELRRSGAEQGDSSMTEQTPEGAGRPAAQNDLPDGVEVSREDAATQPAAKDEQAAAQSDEQQVEPEAAAPAAEQPAADEPAQATGDDRAAELQDQLLREKADFHNYRELMKRERPKDREQAIGSVVEALLPVMDDIHSAREHGDLEGTPFAKIAEKLETTLSRFGVTPVGAVGEPFDPTVHEALMHVQAELPEGTTDTTIVQVIQPGFKIGDRVVRAARVSVADPA